jgi:REP element-mobilizing transposase RayT
MRRDTLAIYVHLVWATWDRLPLITPAIERPLHQVIASEAQKMGCTLLALNSVPDHLHILVRMPSTVAVAELVKQLKGVSSHFCQRHPETGATLQVAGLLWCLQRQPLGRGANCGLHPAAERAPRSRHPDRGTGIGFRRDWARSASGVKTSVGAGRRPGRPVRRLKSSLLGLWPLVGLRRPRAASAEADAQREAPMGGRFPIGAKPSPTGGCLGAGQRPARSAYGRPISNRRTGPRRPGAASAQADAWHASAQGRPISNRRAGGRGEGRRPPGLLLNGTRMYGFSRIFIRADP